MKKTLFTLVTLLGASLFAETFENVEFQLPEAAKEWTVSHSESDTPTGTGKALLYMTPAPLEMFMVVACSGIVEAPVAFDLDAAKAQIQALMPSLDPVLEILESNDQSMLFKMKLDNLVSWGRVIYSEKGTTTLMYQTASEETADPIWIDVLKGATVI